jgi:hypothetical protein
VRAMANIWVDRLTGLDDLDVIRRRIRVDPRGLFGLMAMPRTTAVELFQGESRRVFYPTEQACALLQMHVERAQAFAAMRYADPLRFLKDIDSNESAARLVSCWLLTGLAGVGKTEFRKALERLMPATEILAINAQHPAHPVTSLRNVVVDVKTTQAGLLRTLGNPAVLGTKQRFNLDALLEHVKKWMLRTGAATLIGDELQFVTQSESANTKVAQLLLVLSIIGVPFTYIANYSLVRRLLKRPHEERQRMLSAPKVLLPEEMGSTCWNGVVQFSLAVAPDAFDLDVAEHSDELHRLTAGVGRCLRMLLRDSLEIAHSRKSNRKVAMEDVRRAYRSASYAINRDDVEALAALPHSPKLAKSRPDLVCPIRGVDSERQERFALSPARGKKVAEAVLRGSLSEDESKAARSIAFAAKSAQGRSGTVSRIVPLRRPGLTVEELLRGSEAARLRQGKGDAPKK